MTENIEMTKLKYIPTGNIFNLPYEEAVNVIKSDRGNFVVVGGKEINNDEPAVTETSTYNLVVDENGQDTDNDNTDDNENGQDDTKKMTKTALNKLRVEELENLCNEKNIEIVETDKKADLIEKLLQTNEEEE